MRKVQLTIKQEEVAPATTSDLVVMNNGRTLKEELSTNVLDKFSREVTVSNSMSKIIDGTLDGVYESCVFKGKSLVNLLNHSSLHTSYYSSSENGTITVKNTDGRAWSTMSTNTFSFKANTTYTFIVYDRKNISKIDIDATKASTEDRFLYTTRSDVGGTYLRIKIMREDTTIEGSCKLVILEGDYLEEEIPYFTGLCDVKMPILRNVGKNLIDGTGEYIGLSGVDGSTSSNVLTGDGTLKRYSYIVRCKPNTTYTLTTAGTANRCGLGEYSEYPRIGIVGTKWGNTGTSGTLTITTKPTTIYLVCYSYYYGTAHSQSEMDEIVRGLVVQLEESSTATSYEDHKTNILRTSEEIVLREVNGVQDTYNALTGEYAQRIGEVVLDGGEEWGLSGFTNDNYFVAYCQATTNSAKANSKIKCDKIQYDSRVSVIDTVCEGINIIGDKSLRISMSKSRVSNLSDFTSWLQSNPVTIQYELAEPVTSTIKPSTMTPFAYQNGHVILESGHDGQSLLPELEYSAPASKSGVLSTTSKTILKHEQRLHKFEDLLLRESILMDYRLTLSFLDKM